MTNNVQLKTANNFFSPIIQNLPSQVYQIKKFWAPVVGLSAVAISIDTLISSKLKNAPVFANLNLKVRVHLISGVVTTALCYVASGFLSDLVGAEELPIFIGSTFVVLSLKFAIIYFKSKDLNLHIHFNPISNLTIFTETQTPASQSKGKVGFGDDVKEKYRTIHVKTPGGKGGSNPLNSIGRNQSIPEDHRLLAKGEDEDSVRKVLLKEAFSCLRKRDNSFREKVKKFSQDGNNLDGRDEFGHSVLSLALENEYTFEFIQELVSYGYRIWTCDAIWAEPILSKLIDKDDRSTLRLILDPNLAITPAEKQKLSTLRFSTIESILTKHHETPKVAHQWLAIIYNDYTHLLNDFVRYLIDGTKKGSNGKKKNIGIILELYNDKAKKKIKEIVRDSLLEYAINVLGSADIVNWVDLFYPEKKLKTNCHNLISFLIQHPSISVKNCANPTNVSFIMNFIGQCKPNDQEEKKNKSQKEIEGLIAHSKKLFELHTDKKEAQVALVEYAVRELEEFELIKPWVIIFYPDEKLNARSSDEDIKGVLSKHSSQLVQNLAK